MGAYLSCTVLYPNDEGKYHVEDDYNSCEGPLAGNKSSRRAALLCNRYEGLNFKECNGPHPATVGPKGETAQWFDSKLATCTTIWGRCHVTWYTVTELHERMCTTPGAEEILGKEFIEELYRILQEQPKAIIQFACDQ